MHRTVHLVRTRGRTRQLVVACAVAVAIVAVAGCSSSGSSSKNATVSTVLASPTAWTPKACKRDATTPPKAVAVKGSKSDYDITSFDGVTIRAHWFPLSVSGSKVAPTILMGPGWGLPGDTVTSPHTETIALGALSIHTLKQAGYNVLTWDPRGFGKSTGSVKFDSIDFEAKDVSKLIDWVAAQKRVELDDKGDPRMGMVGGSYGGGIQFVTAAIDCRVDAITPTIAWNSLATSFYKSETLKSGWLNFIAAIAPQQTLEPHIARAAVASKSNGVLSEDDRRFFLSRGPDNVLSRVQVPTLIVQGTVDTLFPLSEGDQNFTQLTQNGIPLSMVWFCGGHGACLNKADPPNYVSTAVLGWLDRYVKLDAKAPVVPSLQSVDQYAKVHVFNTYPVAAGKNLFAMATSGKLKLQAEGGSGPLVASRNEKNVAPGIASGFTAAKATNAVNLTITNGKTRRLLLGAPNLRLGYSGTIDGPITKPTRIFAQLIDDKTGHVLGNQVAAIQVTLDGKTHTIEVPLEMIVFDAKPGSKLTLQLVASSAGYTVPQLGGTVDFSRIELILPTAAS